MEGPEKLPSLSEESVIANVQKKIAEQVAAGKSTNINVFIDDLTGEGPESQAAIVNTLEIAKKIRDSLEEQGQTVEFDRDPADFRDFYFTVS